MQFINPLLALGTLLFAVPLIIHLLNRQRFRRRDWAAMDFLLRAFKKQRKRLRMENLILLLLRCLIPVLLALAIARPYFPQGGGPFPATGTAHYILVFDESYSNGVEPKGGESPHRLARKMAARLLEQLDTRSGQNKVTMVQAGIRVKVPVRENTRLERVRAALSQLDGPQDSAESVVPALAQVADMLEEAKSGVGGRVPDAEVMVYLFTDLQRSCFGDVLLLDKELEAKQDQETKASDLKDSAREIIARIQEHAALTVLDVSNTSSGSGGSEDNLQVQALQMSTPHPMARVSQRVIATVRNLSRATKTVQVTLDIDGDQPARKMVKVEAGGSVEVPFQVMFRETGMTRLRAGIESEGLIADDSRHLVVNVRERLRVLLVEGSTEQEEQLQDSFWLRAILDPTRGEGPPEVTQFGTKVIDSISFLTGKEKLSEYDLIVLCDVERFTSNSVRSLRAAVEGGTGLWIMIGARADLDSYDLHLHGATEQEALLPMRLRRVNEDYAPGGKRYFKSRVVASDHPTMSDFSEEEYRVYFEVTPIYRFAVADKNTILKGAQILSNVLDAESSPLLVASSLGQGKILTMTSAITNKKDRWNRLDYYRIAFRLFHPCARWLSHPVTDPYNVPVGTPITANLRQRPRDLAVVLPERAGGSKELVGEEARPLPGKLFALPPFSNTAYAGIYSYEMNLGGPGSAEPERVPFAANVDPKEGELSYLSWNVVKDRLGVKTILKAIPSTNEGAVTATVTELGEFLLYLVLFFVLGEAVFARFISRRR